MTRSDDQAQHLQTPLSRRQRRLAAGDHGRRLNAVPFLIAAALLALMTLAALWFFVWRDDGDADEVSWQWIEDPADGIHAREVPPEDWEVGWCLTGFVDEQTPADVIDCSQTYDTQIMVRRNISDGPYPGDTTVTQTAHQWCRDDLEVNAEALGETDAEMEIQLWHPTESTWNNDDDRMVSCFLTRTDGAGLSGDFLAEADDEAESVPADEAEQLDEAD